MARFSLHRMRALWRRMSLLDRLAAILVFLFVVSESLRLAGVQTRGGGLPKFGFVLALAYVALRALPWVRSHVLWSLRNRLIVAYILIAVVPVALLLAMVGVSSYLLYLQLGAHLLQDDLQERITQISVTADAIARDLANGNSGAVPGSAESAAMQPSVAALLSTVRAELPGLRLELNSGQRLLEGANGPSARHFAGIVESHDGLWVQAVVAHLMNSRRLVVSLSAPLTSGVLDGLSSELGPIQLTAMRPASLADSRGLALEIDGRRFVSAGRVSSHRRALAPRANWLDVPVNGGSTIEATYFDGPGSAAARAPILATFSVRPSQLNRRLFASLGALREPLVVALALIGATFLILEAAALITGIVLTRTITRAVADLYEATRHIRRADFSHRVRVPRRDQLGILAESFNDMTSSISELIEEQRKRQRLENELSIAREVQSQLFPQSLPRLPGIELSAICRAARGVSGDYYDFIPIGPTRLAIALADISGKGISAALLMASLQAALRSQTLLDGHCSTAEMVSRLNQHLFRNTSEDRYATLFYAVYDTSDRTLLYTNAGHLPPFYVVGGKCYKLEEGGTVVGLFGDAEYKMGTIQVAPGSLLAAYSDGLVEPENVYGEQFGTRRILEEILRHQDARPQQVAEAVVSAAEQWAATPEQADDMTVLVARME